MRIVAMSDSHGKKSALDRIFSMSAENGDIFIHLGDGEKELGMIRSEYPGLDIRHVMGNCDWNSGSPIMTVIEVEGVKILCSHGHRYNVNYGTELIRSVARDNDCRVVLFGHTHCRLQSYEDGIYIMNPGSCSSPRDGKTPSFGYVDITPAGIITNIVEL
ncbi:MAG: metallophosphoesterase family protein [Huintestinicola sp.]